MEVQKKRKVLSVILSLSLLLALFAGCASTSENPAAEVPSTKAPATEKPTEPTEAPTEESTAPTPAEEVYTIRFDLNTTPDDTTDDETFSYEVSGYDENWQPTVTMEPSVLTVAKTENAYIASAIPAPVREGYAFAGWQTRPNVTEADLVNGVSPYLWLFGTQSNYGDESVVMRIADMETLDKNDVGTLYNRSFISAIYLFSRSSAQCALRAIEKVSIITVPNVILLVFCGSRKNHLTNPKICYNINALI